MNSLKAVLMVAVLIIAGTVSASDGWLTDFNKAKAEAVKRDLPILVDFTGSDWCPWCIKLHEEVFSTKVFKDYAKDNFVLLVIDFPRTKPMPQQIREQNSMLARVYGVRGFPTVLILDKNGNEVTRTGYKAVGAETFVAYLKNIKERIADSI